MKRTQVLKITLLVFFAGIAAFDLLTSAFTDRQMFWRQVAALKAVFGGYALYAIIGIIVFGVLAAVQYFWPVSLKRK